MEKILYKEELIYGDISIQKMQQENGKGLLKNYVTSKKANQELITYFEMYENYHS